MAFRKSIIILGILIAIMPYLGFPDSYDQVFYFLVGLFISLVVYFSQSVCGMCGAPLSFGSSHTLHHKGQKHVGAHSDTMDTPEEKREEEVEKEADKSEEKNEEKKEKVVRREESKETSKHTVKKDDLSYDVDDEDDDGVTVM